MVPSAVDRWEHLADGALLVEVKIEPVSVGDLLRQIKMYRSFVAASAIAATAYPMTKDEIAILRREGIHHVRLGDGFKAWCTRESEMGESQEF